MVLDSSITGWVELSTAITNYRLSWITNRGHQLQAELKLPTVVTNYRLSGIIYISQSMHLWNKDTNQLRIMLFANSFWYILPDQRYLTKVKI